MNIPVAPRTNRFVMLLAIGLAASLSACSKSAKSPILGSWQSTESNDVMEFRSDGSLHGTDRYGRTVTGSFDFVDPDHIHLKQTVSSEDRAAGTKMVDNSEAFCKLEIKGDSLTLTDNGGSSASFRRAR